ncbi:phage GP46 family protein [Kaustia mangrovi]|uniref:Phage GP46 family protein n=1 Tax=Kaustia mangrovi TaxID=2593653 RepID=A0A7S8C5Z7_9HYPH|nr:phage GP46 family protein [Kaustia mangrovi]QPC44012.1 phage GP46 family protein [Kaustia mangrovi]
MSDLALVWGDFSADMMVDGGDLVLDDSLQTAVIISLFTDRRADDGDVLPVEFGSDRRGWWGDAFPYEDGDRIGSKLWLLNREKEMQVVLDRAEQYAREALQWLIDDRVCDRIDIEAEIVRPGWLGLGITIHRPDTDPVEYRFNYAWDAQEARAA